MNKKEQTLNRIVDIVVDCCSSEINGVQTLTREDLLGESKKENHVMSRAILCLQLKHEGYSVTTIAMLLGREEQSIRKLIKKGYDFVATSRACRIAAAEVVIECKKLYDDDI